MMWMCVLILMTVTAFAQVRDVQSGLSFFEKNVITVDLGRAPASCVNCDKEEEGVDFRFYSDEPSKNEEFSDQRPGYPFIQSFIKSASGKKPTGFEFTMLGPNELAGAPLARGCDPECVTGRRWEFVSKQGSRRETFMVVNDDAGSGYLSQQMESTIVLLPRKRRPHIEISGDELLVTLTTGEKVIFDRDTKLIKRGVLTEGSIDSTVNRHNRKFAPIKYTGQGIMIRADKRGGDPRLEGDKVVITQKEVSCELKVSELWNPNSAEFKFTDDDQLIQYINSKCSEKFSL